MLLGVSRNGSNCSLYLDDHTKARWKASRLSLTRLVVLGLDKFEQETVAGDPLDHVLDKAFGTARSAFREELAADGALRAISPEPLLPPVAMPGTPRPAGDPQAAAETARMLAAVLRREPTDFEIRRALYAAAAPPGGQPAVRPAARTAPLPPRRRPSGTAIREARTEGSA